MREKITDYSNFTFFPTNNLRPDASCGSELLLQRIRSLQTNVYGSETNDTNPNSWYSNIIMDDDIFNVRAYAVNYKEAINSTSSAS